MSDFLSDLTTPAKAYWQKWEDFRSQNKLQDFKPSTIGYKAEGINNFNEIIAGLSKTGLIDQCHIGYVDNRYIASIVLHKPFFKDIYIIKLMQKRPNSKDPTGLDHFDFYVNNLKDIEKLFKDKSITTWEPESNESHYWLSLRFANTEAKFVDHLVLDVCVKELKNASSRIGYKPISI